MSRFPAFALAALSVFVCGAAAAQTQTFKTEKYDVAVETVADGLSYPWSLAFLPDGAMLITEKTGALRHVTGDQVSAPIPGVPEVWVNRQGGLLDVVVDPDFATNQTIFFSFSEPSADRRTGGTAIARARLILDPAPRLEDVTIIFTQNKKTDSGHHFGSRIVIAPDGTLFFTIGERGDGDRAQDPFDHAGSVLRINKDGTVPANNPFADGKKGAPEIWSIGHRNPQGAVLHKGTRTVWTVEHGARGGDEINHPQPGRNYGWPVISYGRHYWGGQIGVGTHKEGMEQPVYYWDPSIAPSGMAHYDGDKFPEWRGNLFIGALRGQLLARLELNGERVTHEERLFTDALGRIRDVRQGPDGYLYLLTDDRNGKLLRVRPSQD